MVRVVRAHLADLFDQLKTVEEAVAAAREEFIRLRGSVDSLGELALVESWKSAEQALDQAVRSLDDLVDRTDDTSDGDDERPR